MTATSHSLIKCVGNQCDNAITNLEQKAPEVEAAVSNLKTIMHNINRGLKKVRIKETSEEYLYSITLDDAVDALCDMKADDDMLEKRTDTTAKENATKQKEPDYTQSGNPCKTSGGYKCQKI